jgi:hypothetical protein
VTPVLALLSGQPQPICRPDGGLRRAIDPPEIAPPKIVLSLRVSEIQGRVAEHYARHIGIGFERAGDAIAIVLS